MTDLTGQNLGRYHVIEPLGQGGMASVYKAYDTSLERHVAIKIIRSDIGVENQGEFLKRFQREAKSLAQLDHPFILKVLDYGDRDGLPYLVMPFLEGGTLKDKMGQPVSFEKAAALLAPIARALEFAHQQNVIHRDVKPANILISKSGAPILSDFGIAKILGQSGSTQLTGAGVGIGTPDYMAPEQWTGIADSRTDIYSLGVVFYQMVTGRLPYSAETPAAVLIKHLRDPLPRPTTFVHDLPEVVEQILFKALAKEPENRYQTMGELALALEELVGRMPAPSQADLKTQVGLDAAVVAAQHVTPQPVSVDATRIADAPRPSPINLLLSWKLWLPVALIALIAVGGWWLANNRPEPSQPVAVIPDSKAEAPEQIFPSTDTAQSIFTRTSPLAATSTTAFTSTPEPTTEPAATSTPSLRLGQTINQSLGSNRIWGGLLFSPNGSTITALSLATFKIGNRSNNYEWTYFNNAEIVPLDSSTLEQLPLVPLEAPSSPATLGFLTYDGQTAGGLTESRLLHLWQTSDGSLQRQQILEGSSSDMYVFEISPDGEILAGIYGRGIYLWQVADGRLLRTLRMPDDALYSPLAFSPDGQTLVSAGGNTVQVWRVSDGTLLQSIKEPGSVYSVAVAPDGKLIAAGMKSGNIDLWQAEDSAFVRTLKGSKTGVTSMVFSPDGQYLASTEAGNIDLFRVEDGSLLQTYEDEFGLSIAELLFSPDSQILASLSSMGILHLWGVVP